MVLGLDLDAALLQSEHHLGADILQRVGRRRGEVALLVADLVAGVRPVGLGAAGPLPFVAVDVVIRFVLVLVEADAIEDEKFRLRSEMSDVGDARRFHVGFRFAGNIARILGIIFARDRILDVAGHRQRLHHEGVDDRRFRLGNDEHVALVDRLPTPHRRPVKAEALFKTPLGQGLDGDGEVLRRSGEVHESQIDGPDFAFPAQGQNLFWGHQFSTCETVERRVFTKCLFVHHKRRANCVPGTPTVRPRKAFRGLESVSVC